MLFLLIFIVFLAFATYGLEWLIQQPGSLTLEFAGRHLEASIPVVIGGALLSIALIILIWTLIVALIKLPKRLVGGSRERRRERGLDVLSQGLVAVGAGDVTRAKKAATLAHKLLPNEPLTQILNAQAAQLSGDLQGAAKAFHKMTLNPETKLLGLRGLHVEAKRRKDPEAAHHFAKEAHDIAPVPWAGGALVEHHAGQGDWEKARETIEKNLQAKAIDQDTAQRQRAVVETALAMEQERTQPHDALHLARLALKRRPGFAPAAAVAFRVLVRHGDVKQALKLIESLWSKNAHAELGALYLEALSSETNSGRLAQIEKLIRLAPNAAESRHLLAQAALSARDFNKARQALAPLLAEGQIPTARSCLLMAEIEEAENGAGGSVREWLAKGSRAPRDPVWIAENVVAKHWLPISPASGKLDAFDWKSPPDSIQRFGDPLEPQITASPSEILEITGPKASASS
jgi:HemY protein